MSRTGGQSEWLRAQAHAQKAAARARGDSRMEDAKKKAESISEAFTKLVETVRTQQTRLTRLAVFTAEQTVRIVEYRAGWRAEWQRAQDAIDQVEELRALLAKEWGVFPLNVVRVVNEKGPVWATITSSGGELTVPTVNGQPPDGGTTMSEPQLRATAKKRAGKKGKRKNPLGEQECERCAHVRAVHSGGAGEGPCTACTDPSDCDAYVGPEQMVSDPLGVLPPTISAQGVNTAPHAPSTGPGEEGPQDGT